MVKPPFSNMLPVLLLFGVAQGLFLAFVVAGIKKGNRKANRILAGILVLFSIDLTQGFLSVTYALAKIPCLIGVNWPLAFLYGPLVYFYVQTLTASRRDASRWRLSAHFMPTALLYLYLLPSYLADPELKARAWIVQNGIFKNYTHTVDPILYVLIFQIAGYLVLSLYLLKVHSIKIRQNFSSIETISLAWLKNLIFAFIGLLCIYAFYAVSSQFFGIYKEAEYLFHFITAVLIYVFAYKGIQQPEIFALQGYTPARDGIGANDGPAEQPAASSDKGQSTEAIDCADKYRKSALTEEQAEKILDRLALIMEKEKTYREMGLTLPTLAHMLDVSQHHLSQVINGKLNKSYFDFVNEYRVEDAKRAIIAPDADRFSILGIAMEAGFNSKSAFYTAFKKHTGMTPTQFKDRLARP
jgi:AraC-like DNA-binding protein